jgi:hypothetical protein
MSSEIIRLISIYFLAIALLDLYYSMNNEENAAQNLSRRNMSIPKQFISATIFPCILVYGSGVVKQGRIDTCLTENAPACKCDG